MEARIKYRDDSETYLLSNEKIKGNISIGSLVQEGMSLERGNYIKTAGVELEISFEKEKEIQTFYELFGYILKMCQFMTCRRNVIFEEIYLKKKCEQYPEMDKDIAKCYVYYGYSEATEKKIVSCITFDVLGKCIDKLMDSIVNNRPKKPQFNIGFIPENDDDANIYSSMKIREVCSALESEMELAKIKVKQEQEFDNLVGILKSIVIKHREGEKPLTDTKVYEYILGTLNHLSGALADRIDECFERCYPIMEERISREQIDNIVNFRNTITHGNYMPLDVELADSTHMLMKLVYCCVLKRIGMEDDTIKELFTRNIIS